MSAQHIPTVRYHPSEPPLSIETAEELAALGPAWQDHPYTPEEMAAWQEAQAVRADDADEDSRPTETPTPRARR